MASFFGKIFFFCLNTKLSGIKNCPKKKFCKSDNFVIFENIDENVPSSSLCKLQIKITKGSQKTYSALQIKPTFLPLMEWFEVTLTQQKDP